MYHKATPQLAPLFPEHIVHYTLFRHHRIQYILFPCHSSDSNYFSFITTPFPHFCFHNPIETNTLPQTLSTTFPQLLFIFLNIISTILSVPQTIHLRATFPRHFLYHYLIFSISFPPHFHFHKLSTT